MNRTTSSSWTALLQRIALGGALLTGVATSGTACTAAAPGADASESSVIIYKNNSEWINAVVYTSEDAETRAVNVILRYCRPGVDVDPANPGACEHTQLHQMPLATYETKLVAHLHSQHMDQAFVNLTRRLIMSRIRPEVTLDLSAEDAVLFADITAPFLEGRSSPTVETVPQPTQPRVVLSCDRAEGRRICNAIGELTNAYFENCGADCTRAWETRAARFADIQYWVKTIREQGWEIDYGVYSRAWDAASYICEKSHDVTNQSAPARTYRANFNTGMSWLQALQGEHTAITRSCSF